LIERRPSGPRALSPAVTITTRLASSKPQNTSKEIDMSLGSGLTALLIGMFVLVIGMYAWASVAGTFAFFIGFALAIGGAAIMFAQARHGRAR
jgi:hypothetical protein